MVAACPNCRLAATSTAVTGASAAASTRKLTGTRTSPVAAYIVVSPPTSTTLGADAATPLTHNPAAPTDPARPIRWLLTSPLRHPQWRRAPAAVRPGSPAPGTA